MASIKELMTQIPRGKRTIWVGMLAVGYIIMVSFLIWIFGTHNFPGMLVWLLPVSYGLIMIAILVALSPLVIFFDLRRLVRSPQPKRVPSFFLWGIALILLIAPMGAYIGLGSDILLRSAGDKTPQLVMLDGTGANGIPDFALLAWTSRKSTMTLTYGSNLSMANTVSDQVPTRTHALVMDDLLPATTYFYSWDNGQTIQNFTTFSGQNSTLHFAFSSDAHFGRPASNNTATLKILEQVANPAHGFDAFFFGGDLVEMGGTDAHWAEAMVAIAPYLNSIPFRSAIGNHDAQFGAERMYIDYFYPESAPVATGTPLYYHIRINDIHLFFLDLEWGIETYDAAQKAWFEAQIATVAPSDWTFVFCHGVFYSSGTESAGVNWGDNSGMIDTLVPLFEAHDVDMVFTGHNHHIEVLEKNGIYYHVVGGFGGHPDSEKTYTSPHSLAYFHHQFGFVDVAITGDEASVVVRTPEFVPLYNYTTPFFSLISKNPPFFL
jgi:hypothetical protein